MIDDNLIKRIQSMIDRYEDIHPQLAQELLSDYIKLVEQNAELHKANEKHKAQLKSLIQCSDMNTGYEPSLSVFQREIDISKELVGNE